MKFNLKVSPNYRNELSTQGIMFHLLLGLLVVFIASDVYYFTNYGFDYGIRAILLLIVSILSATFTEVLWCVFTKQDIKKFLSSSFPWISAIILTLMCQVSISYYALAISTVIAIFFGKLAFGGFGQNIFNPAALGRAVIMASFGGSVVADFVSSATPTTAISSNGWILTDSILNSYGGISNMFIGMYNGAIGETSALVILLVGIYLALKNVIDFRVPLTYLLTLFVTTLIIGLFNNQGIEYPLFHLFTGGAIFGAVFMMTDPVTNPTSIPGRIVFAMGCAFLTVLIRLNASLPEGVLYSILIMNMLSGSIEKMFDSNQIKGEKQNLRKVLICFILGLVLSVSFTLYKSNNKETAFENNNVVIKI